VIDDAGNSWQSQPHGCGERLSTLSHPALGSGDRFKSIMYNAENDNKMHLFLRSRRIYTNLNVHLFADKCLK